jgi:hypothetical protein
MSKQRRRAKPVHFAGRDWERNEMGVPERCEVCFKRPPVYWARFVGRILAACACEECSERPTVVKREPITPEDRGQLAVAWAQYGAALDDAPGGIGSDRIP